MKATSPPSLLFCTVTVKNLKHQLSLATSHLHRNTQRRDSGGQQGTRANGMRSEGCFQKPFILVHKRADIMKTTVTEN